MTHIMLVCVSIRQVFKYCPDDFSIWLIFRRVAVVCNVCVWFGCGTEGRHRRSAPGESAGLVLLWTDVLSRHLEDGMFTCEHT